MLKNQRIFRITLAVAAFVIDLLIWGGDTQTWSGEQLPLWAVVLPMALGYACLTITRSPIPGYLALLLLNVGGLLAPGIENLVGFLLAVFLMARLLPHRPALFALCGAVIPLMVNSNIEAVFFDNTDAGFLLINAGLRATLIGAVWLAGRALYRGQHRLTTERRWAEEARSEATAVERLRISRDLHDSVAHSMTAIVLQVAGVRAVLNSPSTTVDVDKVLSDIQSTAEQSMRELHRLLGILRSDSDEPEPRTHGLEELKGLIDSARATGLDVSSTQNGTVQALDPSIAHAAYRVVQEGLSNVMKHAGDGAQVELTQDWSPGQLTISVRSISGVAARPAVSGGYGLLGLRERITVSGGSLHNGPTTNGYLLKATLPVTAVPGAQHRNPMEEA